MTQTKMPVRVLHLMSSPFGLGGAEKLLLDMSGLYDPEKTRAYYCNLFSPPSRPGFLSEALDRAGLERIEVTGHRWYHLPSVIRQLKARMREHEIDIVHTQLLHATIVAGWCRKFGAPAKYVVTQQYTREGHSRNGLNLPQERMLGRALRRFDKVFPVSSAVAKDVIKFGVIPDRVRIVPNGIDLDNFDAQATVENERLLSLRAAGKFIIGSVGNLQPQKDHKSLLLAMPAVLKAFPEAHLVIAGEGVERRLLEELIADLGIAEIVSLPGFEANIPSFLTGIDLYVHPSIHEAFGIAVIEAMAAKKCVIATPVEGIPDIIIDRENGIFVPPAAPQILAERIVEAIGSPHLRSLGQKARARVESRFTLQAIVREYEAEYEFLTGKGNGTPV